MTVTERRPAAVSRAFALLLVVALVVVAVAGAAHAGAAPAHDGGCSICHAWVAGSGIALPPAPLVVPPSTSHVSAPRFPETPVVAIDPHRLPAPRGPPVSA